MQKLKDYFSKGVLTLELNCIFKKGLLQKWDIDIGSKIKNVIWVFCESSNLQHKKNIDKWIIFIKWFNNLITLTS